MIDIWVSDVLKDSDSFPFPPEFDCFLPVSSMNINESISNDHQWLSNLQEICNMNCKMAGLMGAAAGGAAGHAAQKKLKEKSEEPSTRGKRDNLCCCKFIFQSV